MNLRPLPCAPAAVRLPGSAVLLLASLLALLVLRPAAVQAFPPAPPHTLFGLVRDELGNPVQSTRAVVVLETLSGVRISSDIVPNLKPGVNFEISVPMDAGLTADPYRPTALRPTVGFKIRVVIAGVEYLPIEMRGDYSRLGAPAGRTRIDLTLGEDSDGDGLPDAWERAVLAATGGTGGLAGVRPDGDSDGDGLSNLREYIAGTYAFDPADGFAVRLAAASGGQAELEFLAIRGRSYRLEGSSDLGRWTALPFRLVSPVRETATRLRYDAGDVQLVRISVPVSAGAFGSFRLAVE